jgi:hypothetical protein
MRLLIDFDVKDFDDDKVQMALDECRNLCAGCDTNTEKCLVSQNDCVVKNAIEALSGMIRIGKGIRRYQEVGKV